MPSAVLLGALHGLEPGHSKTMMAAFIIAVRGTVSQAALLGLSATFSHTLVVWAVAVAGIYFGGKLDTDTAEPYFQVGSGVIIIAIACWIIRGLRYQAVFRRNTTHSHDHAHESTHAQPHALVSDREDAHALKHAEAIRKNFLGREVTNGQIVIFGLTGGLIPCPAALTVLLLCLQLKRSVLGLGLVFCFSIGLALTLVTSGIIAALSLRQLHKHLGEAHASKLSALAYKAPYLSSLLIIGVGVFVSGRGAIALGWVRPF